MVGIVEVLKGARAYVNAEIVVLSKVNRVFRENA